MKSRAIDVHHCQFTVNHYTETQRRASWVLNLLWQRQRSKSVAPIQRRTEMKSFTVTLPKLFVLLMFLCLPRPQITAQGIPEPDLIMYGKITVRDTNNTRLTVGTLSWQFQSASRTVVIATPLTNINDQFSYLLRVPCETEIGGFVASPNVIRLLSVPTLYDRSRITVTTDRTNQATLVNPAQASFNLASQDRGRIERIDLEISTVPCLDSDANGLPDC
jgi:hypothetical protein